MYIYLVNHGYVLMFSFLWFPSEREPRSCSSRKPYKNNQRRKPSKKTFLATTETINKPTTETIKQSCHDGNHKTTSDGNQS